MDVDVFLMNVGIVFKIVLSCIFIVVIDFIKDRKKESLFF